MTSWRKKAEDELIKKLCLEISPNYSHATYEQIAAVVSAIESIQLEYEMLWAIMSWGYEIFMPEKIFNHKQFEKYTLQAENLHNEFMENYEEWLRLYEEKAKTILSNSGLPFELEFIHFDGDVFKLVKDDKKFHLLSYFDYRWYRSA